MLFEVWTLLYSPLAEPNRSVGERAEPSERAEPAGQPLHTMPIRAYQ
jgi:hypothetical protein